MPSATPKSSAPAIPVRMFWGLMLGLHLRPVLAVCTIWSSAAADVGSDISALRTAGLLASALFFALKLANVPWLRMNPGWRSAGGALALVGLLHLGMIARTTSQTAPALPLGAVAVLAGVLEFEILRRALKALRGLSTQERPTPLLGLAFLEQLARQSIPQSGSLVLAAMAPRAPPHRALSD